MATENYVALLGMAMGLAEVSVINDVKQATLRLFTLRKRMRTGADEDGTDEIVVITKDSELISQMKKIHENEIVSIVGNFCSVDTVKTFCCENEKCTAYNAPVEYKSTVSYINPIEIMPVAWSPKMTDVDAKLWLHKYREHSNTVRLIGHACSQVKHIPLEVLNRKTGLKELLHLWQLRIGVKRQKLVKSSLSSIDFITVNSYEELPDMTEGDFVIINGFVRSKTHTKTRKCSCCQKEIVTKNESLCVVPYRVEHIKMIKED